MGHLLTVGFVLLIGVVHFGVFAKAKTTITKTFEDNGVVPDVISKAPSAVVKVKYPSGAVVRKGNELTPTQVKDEPQVSYEADDSQFYTVIMTDPDAPSRQEPSFREWHHWLVVNVPGNKVSQGDTLSAYVGSGPPQGTGLHRYVFLVYKQPGKINFDEPHLPNNAIEHRNGFSSAKFAKKYNLGDPIAGNLYLAQWDEYVPQVYKQLGALHLLQKH